MRAPRDPFLAGFAAFARAEGEAHPAMADQMATLADALGRCTPLQPGPQPAHQVVEAHLGPGLDAAEGPAGDLLRLVADRIGWTLPYPEHAGEPDMDHLRANYAYSPIVGASPVGDGGAGEPSPLYASDEVFAGAVVHGPGAAYPSHVHKSEEVFWVTAGTADWQKGDAWRVDGPGAVIHHPSGTRHATITRDEPLLMLFAWVSDPDSIPVIVRH